MDSFLTHCRTAADIADRLDLPEAVKAALPQAFERWDSHGVPGGLCGDAIIPVMRVVHIADDAEVHARFDAAAAARILADAQMFRALGEQRPHRPPLDPDERAEILRAEVTAGRLDGDAVAAVLAAAQGRRPRRRARIAGRTARELDVLALLVRGRSTREIAQALGRRPTSPPRSRCAA